MKTAAIVAEYNPLHNGHAYHIAKTREVGATHIVVIMSGSAVQRGDFPLLDKFTRARAAVLCGADLALELPAPYACAAANRFAASAVSIAAGIRCDMLSFGCESGDVSLLRRAADAMYCGDTAQRIKQLTAQGTGYPQAAQLAAAQSDPQAADLLCGANNLLAAEYLHAIKVLGADLEPVAVKRRGAQHDAEPEADTASASWLRERLAQGAAAGELSQYIPQSVLSLLEAQQQSGKASGGLEVLQQAALYRLRTISDEECAALADSECGLPQRLCRAAARHGTLERVMSEAGAKQFTAARVRRTVMAMLLQIDRGMYAPAPYARILAANERAADILKNVPADFPVSHSPAKLEKTGALAKSLLLCEHRAFSAFCLAQQSPLPPEQDYTRKFTVENTARV